MRRLFWVMHCCLLHFSQMSKPLAAVQITLLLFTAYISMIDSTLAFLHLRDNWRSIGQFTSRTSHIKRN